MMPLDIVPLTDKHFEDAAVLVTAGYRLQRRDTPLLPSRYENRRVIVSLLQKILAQGPAVAAIRGGCMVGFLSGWIIDELRGKRAVYCPEWAHAADPLDQREIYEALYTALSRQWVADGCMAHAVTCLAHDPEIIQTWFRSGFGMIVIDAIRGPGPVPPAPTDVDIRRAGPRDIDVVMTFSRLLEQYMAQAPIFRLPSEELKRESVAQHLANPAHPYWLAYSDGEPIAYLGMEAGCTSACYIIRDEKTISLTAAFTKDPFRSRGTATALLSTALEWARSAGYERCAVDFESANSLAARFWLKHFQPVCYSLINHVDERLARR